MDLHVAPQVMLSGERLVTDQAPEDPAPVVVKSVYPHGSLSSEDLLTVCARVHGFALVSGRQVVLKGLLVGKLIATKTAPKGLRVWTWSVSTAAAVELLPVSNQCVFTAEALRTNIADVFLASRSVAEGNLMEKITWSWPEVDVVLGFNMDFQVPLVLVGLVTQTALEHHCLLGLPLSWQTTDLDMIVKVVCSLEKSTTLGTEMLRWWRWLVHLFLVIVALDPAAKLLFTLVTICGVQVHCSLVKVQVATGLVLLLTNVTSPCGEQLLPC